MISKEDKKELADMIKKSTKKKKGKKGTSQLKKKFISKKIFRKSRATLNLPEHQPAEYVSRFFNKEWRGVQDEQSLFFK